MFVSDLLNFFEDAMTQGYGYGCNEDELADVFPEDVFTDEKAWQDGWNRDEQGQL
jgi:hypothetical protein